MEWYLYGVGAAFLLGFYRVIVTSGALRSQRTKNLKLVGLYYSCAQANWIPGEASARKYLGYLTYALLLSPLLSWLVVASLVVQLVIRRSNTGLVPKHASEQAKAALQRLDVPGLTRREVTAVLAQVAEACGREFQAEPLDLEEDGTATVTVNRSHRTVRFWSRTDDWHGQYESIYEYRLNGTEVDIRLLERGSDYLSEKEVLVQDGVVLEEAVRARNFDNDDNALAKLRAEVEWGPLQNALVRYYVLFQHADSLPEAEFRRALRQDMETIKGDCTRLCDAARSVGLHVVEDDAGYELRYPGGAECPEEKRQALSAALEPFERTVSPLVKGRLGEAKTLVHDLEALLT